MIGVSNERGLEVSSRSTSANIARYIEVRKDWFAYNPMRINVGSIGLADDDSKTGYTSPDYTVFSCKDGLLPKYLLRFLKSEYGLEAVARHSSGAVRKRLYYSGLSEIELEIPSIEEQKNLISRFQTAERAAGFILNENSDAIEIPLLRQAILQAAIQGELTVDWRAENSNVEDATELIKRIQAEKARLIAEKAIRRGKRQESIGDPRVELSIPPDWGFPELDDITMLITDGTHQTPSYTDKGRPFLSAQNVKPFRFMPEKHRFVSEEAFVEYRKNRTPVKGDLLLGRVGSVGETAVIDQDIEFAFYVSLGLVKVFPQFNNSDFLTIVFNSPYGIKYAKGNTSSKGASAGNFNLGRIRSFPIPFPSLEEQAAIVERVKALMATCRELEAEIERSRNHAADLLQAVLKEAFAPAS